MTDNEIIKALECCVQYTTTDVRTYKGMPLEVFSQAVLDLINRQKAEIERLESNLKFVRGTVERMRKYDEERDIRLHARLTETARAEAIKEFAERLKQKGHRGVCAGGLGFIIHKDIDNLVKEMTEDQQSNIDKIQ